MKYSITRSGLDWLLCIWEPAPVSSMRTSPFLYKVKLKFASELEALSALEQYKQVYQLQDERDLISA
ncbi:hypothetical protein ACQ4M4_15450 [Leptolyngbya sp. AN02str]|uniref:hypothetical protein n=1 Tax=Leptolyngbya sp. AN02str TaxID=3423363 RepID=UPI003D317215